MLESLVFSHTKVFSLALKDQCLLHVRNKTEITFISQEYSYTRELSMHSVSTLLEGILPNL